MTLDERIQQLEEELVLTRKMNAELRQNNDYIRENLQSWIESFLRCLKETKVAESREALQRETARRVEVLWGTWQDYGTSCNRFIQQAEKDKDRWKGKALRFAGIVEQWCRRGVKNVDIGAILDEADTLLGMAVLDATIKEESKKSADKW